MNIVQWAMDQLSIPTVREIMNDPRFRDQINGITDSLEITRYRAAKLLQTSMLAGYNRG